MKKLPDIVLIRRRTDESFAVDLIRRDGRQQTHRFADASDAHAFADAVRAVGRLLDLRIDEGKASSEVSIQ